jgi:hypothetical protein
MTAVSRERWIDGLSVVFGLGVTFLIVNWIHFRWFEVSVILYACVVDLVVACALLLPIHIYLCRARWRERGVELSLCAVIGALGVLLYSVMGPTVIDRSLSIYIVEKVDQRGGAVAEAAIPAIFVEEYMPEFRLVDVRLTEQLHSGTLTLDGGCLHLTARGRFLADVMKVYRANFLPRRRVLRGEVTDQLTRPFDGAEQRVDTAC